MSKPASTSCPFCEKQGLPILPLRYAVARTDFDEALPHWQALDLPSGTGGGVTDIRLPDESAKYTTRLLRPGYLYVFNEARGEWKAYLVTTLGYLYEFDIENVTPPDADDIEFSCFRTGEEFVARCITVPDARNATKLWLGFSPTAWTAAVLARHRKQAYRERHMRVIDVQQWVGGNSGQPHTAEFTRLTTVVNEFARAGVEREARQALPTLRQMHDPETGEQRMVTDLPADEVWAYPTFNFSPHEFHGFGHEAEGLVAWAEKAADNLGVPAMLVILDDPTAITMELGALMGARLSDFLAQDSLQRPLAISSLVASLEEAIRNNAELDQIRSAQNRAVWKAHPWNHPLYIGVRDGRTALVQHHERRLRSDRAYKAQWDAKLEAARQQAADGLTDDYLEDVAEKAWRKYQDKLQPGEPEHWLQTVYQPQLEAYDQQVLVPLAHAHQSWLRSPATLASLECNHDDADGESGAGYVQSLLLCIQDTQQNKICFDNYADWLSANASDPKNLLQRALLHNQREVIEALDGAVPGSGLTKEALPKVEWHRLIRLYRGSLTHVSVGGQTLAAQLLVALGGPIMKVLDGMVDHTVGRTLVALGVIAHAPIIPVSHAGTVDQAMDVMVGLMKQVNPDGLGDVDADLLKRRLEIRSRGKRKVIQNRGPDGRFAPGEVRLRVDRFAIGQLDGKGGAAERADRAALAVLSMDEWPRNGIARFRAMFGTDSRLAVVGLILQAIGANQIAGKLDETMAHRRVESTWRFRSSVVAIIGGVGQLFHDGIINGSKAGSVRLARAAGSMWNKALGLMSRVAGFAAGAIIAVVDFGNAISEIRKRNVGMFWLYAASAVVGVGAAAALGGLLGATIFGLSATGVGLVLVLIGIAIALTIDFFKTDELQEWAERCFFGALGAEKRYQDLEQEMAQFDVVMKALGPKKKEEDAGGEEAPDLVPSAG